MQTMKQNILAYIKRRGHVSYAELSRDIEGFNGDFEDQIKPNLILWSGLSLEASTAISELIKERAINISPTTAMIYMIDGIMPGLPIAKRIMAYKKPHWLPVTFNT